MGIIVPYAATKRTLRAAAVCLMLAGSARTADLAAIDADAMSGDPERILRSIRAYESLRSDAAEVLWRLIRAYYNYYDEFTERDRSKQQWAADQGRAVAEAARAKFPHEAEIAYYYGTIGLAYADVHRLKAAFLIEDLCEALEEARRSDPTQDGGGPDRRLAFLYAMPRPIGYGDREKALQHLRAAARIDPERASNRGGLAKTLADLKRYDEGWPHVQFVRAGKFRASSEHWKTIWLRRIEEIAADYPQNRKQADR